MNKLNNKTVLITGGTGFIGSHLSRELVKRGYKVIVLGKGCFQKAKFPGKIKFYKADVCSKNLDKIFKKEYPLIVYHLAAYLPKSNIEKPAYNVKNIKTNVLGTLNVLEACRKYGVKKIIFSSSAAVYGNPLVIPTPENYPAKPTSLYGLAKLASEKLFEVFYKLYNINYVILRYSNVYGPGQKPGKQGSLVADFIKKISQDEQVIVNRSGKQTRDYVYIDDVITANLLAMKTNKVGTYNAGSGSETGINEIFYKICKIFGKEIKPHYKSAGKTEIERSFLKIDKIKKDLRWEPKNSLDAGLKKIINNLK